MTTPALESEFRYYLAHQAELLREHEGKVVVIQGERVIGVYDTEMTAVAETSKTHKLGTFLVQRVTPGNAGHSQTFHSRVSFG